MHFVSIICPVFNEEKFIDKCVESIIQQDYPKEFMEVFFVDGMSIDSTRSKIEKYSQKYSYLKLLENKNKIVPCALNIGIENAKGDVIIRIDGHCVYPLNYISVLVTNLFELNADNVGGVWNTLPANNTTKSKAIAIASSHKFGVGDSKHKVGVSKTVETDTVPFGCYRREVFDKIGFFDEELIRNQDDEFNARLIKNGGKIFLIPGLVINYTARDSVKKMSKMYYQYGLFKPLVNKKLGAPATIRQFFPVTFLLGLILGALLSIYSNFFLIPYATVLFLYLFLATLFAFRSANQNKNYKLIAVLPAVFFVIHISYGYGYLVGIYKIVMHQKFNVEINR
jgi:glycosyltransferase involved in cell wall biosynthesis